MYEKEKQNIDWIRIILKVLICFLILLLVIKIISVMIGNKKDKSMKEVMHTNLTMISETVESHYKKEAAEYKLGKTVKYTLADLKNKKIIGDIKDEKGASCNLNSSYVEITRLDTEIQFKTYLVCPNITDYKDDFVSYDTKTTNKKVKTTKKAKKKTTKKVTTTKKAPKTNKTTKPVKTTKPIKTTINKNIKQVSFNTNGGSLIKSQSVKVGSLVKYIKPERKGYTFVGWFNNGVQYDFNTPVKEDIVLVAKWIKN